MISYWVYLMISLDTDTPLGKSYEQWTSGQACIVENIPTKLKSVR